MEKPITDLETLRVALQAMERKEVLTLADEAGVAGSTAQKIRSGHIESPAYAKVAALIKVLNARRKAKRKPEQVRTSEPQPAGV